MHFFQFNFLWALTTVHKLTDRCWYAQRALELKGKFDQFSAIIYYSHYNLDFCSDNRELLQIILCTFTVKIVKFCCNSSKRSNLHKENILCFYFNSRSNILQNKGSSTPGINVVLKNFANKPRIIPKSSLRDSNYTKFAKYFATKQHLITISSASI